MSTAVTDPAPGLDVPDCFNIVVEKGHVTGPEPPQVRYIITRVTHSQNFIVSAKKRVDDGPTGPHLVRVVAPRSLPIAQHLEAIVRVETILRGGPGGAGGIPVQYPGAEELYGRGISIVHVTTPDELGEFEKKGPSAGVGQSRPTEEQRALFDEAVAIIEGWVA